MILDEPLQRTGIYDDPAEDKWSNKTYSERNDRRWSHPYIDCHRWPMGEKWLHPEIPLERRAHQHTESSPVVHSDASLEEISRLTFDWRKRDGLRQIIAGGVGLALRAEKWIKRWTPHSRASRAIDRAALTWTSSNEKFLSKQRHRASMNHAEEISLTVFRFDGQLNWSPHSNAPGHGEPRLHLWRERARKKEIMFFMRPDENSHVCLPLNYLHRSLKASYRTYREKNLAEITQ